MSHRAGPSLLVRNLSRDTRLEDLRYEAEKYGRVRDVYMPKDYYTGEPRGIGFIEFTDERDAEECKYNMDRMILAGKEISVDYAKEGRKRPDDYRRAGYSRYGYRGGGGGGGYGGGGGGGGYRDYDRGRDRDRYSRRSPSPRRRRSYSRSPPRRRRSPSPDRDPSRERDRSVSRSRSPARSPDRNRSPRNDRSPRDDRSPSRERSPRD